jgi:hypothetical protein
MKLKKGKEWGHIKKIHKKVYEPDKEGLMGLVSKPKTLARRKTNLKRKGSMGLDHKQHQEEDELEKGW